MALTDRLSEDNDAFIRNEMKNQDETISNNNMKNKMAAEFNIKMASGDQIERLTEIQQFYDGACVLVTGATGFMGKVLIEKLLRSCAGITDIYLLVRNKRGKNIDERIDDLIASPCFNRLKQEAPKFHTKLHAIAGDIGSAGLGMSDADRQLLSRHVTIVFHVAATVRFDEPMKMAVEQNVRGTREVMTMCKTFNKIKAVVHVSTAYANCPRLDIAEKLYDLPLDCDKAIHMAEENTAEQLNSITQDLLGEWPNTYSFTKAISEDAVKKYGPGLPVGVFRPAIVVCTNAEPMPGWIDNLYGPTGVIVGVASGLMRTLNINGTCPANVVPCDMVINALIASANDISKRSLTSDVIPVYNYTTPPANKITWEGYISKYLLYGNDYPTSRAIWYYYLVLATNRAYYLVLRFLLHIIPALIMDMGFVMTGHKPQMVRVYDKIHKFSDVIAYFGVNTWRFDDDNVYNAWDNLSSADQKLFPFDMRSLSWDEFVAGSICGLRENIMKDDISTVPAARIRMRKLYWLHRTTQVFIFCMFAWFAWALLNTVYSLVAGR